MYNCSSFLEEKVGLDKYRKRYYFITILHGSKNVPKSIHMQRP